MEYHYTHGGTHLFIDEVHKYPSWQTLIKNIYDEYPDLHVAFTGSSMLKIDNSKADLSRRLSDYTLHVPFSLKSDYSLAVSGNSRIFADEM